jgi:E3 ubiquitin-protein ligase UBR7
LVELFNKRDFVCDCGTTRLPKTSPCTLRIHPETNTKAGVHSEAPEANNNYNQNFKNKFCGCECDYDADSQKGTMFQCLGLGTAEQGGCGEDWWHPGCVVGLGPDWNEDSAREVKHKTEGLLESIAEVAEAEVATPSAEETPSGPTTEIENTTLPTAEGGADDDDDPPLPPGFPSEDDFEGFICYKCVEAHPWIKKYAGAKGFLQPVFRRSAAPSPETGLVARAGQAVESLVEGSSSKKRKAENDEEPLASAAKKLKEGVSESVSAATNEVAALANNAVSAVSSIMPTSDEPSCKVKDIDAPRGELSLFFKADFREHLCRCPDCFPLLKPHPQLLEEEENYEPEMSEGEDADGRSTVGSGSTYDRGESALKNVDRVRAIEGVMAYNHLKDKLKPFFQQFAESGQAISAEDIKAHFAKMRGDEMEIQEAKDAPKEDTRKEQSGY